MQPSDFRPQNAPAVPYVPTDQRYDTMNYRRCGRSGVMLPALSLGLWKNFGAETPFAHSLHLLHVAFDHGITHFDLANNYGSPYGSAEATMGRALRESLHPYRDELFISTKAGYDMWPGPYGNWGSRKYLMASLDQSLQRMGLDYVDLFYSHRYDPDTPLEETLQALVDVVRAGKALYVGISRWPLEAMLRAFSYLAAHDVPCLAYQGRINLIDREPMAKGILEACRQHGVGFVSFSPLAQGLLSDRYLHGRVPDDSRMALGQTLRRERLTPQLQSQLEQLARWAGAHGQSASEVALRWVLSQAGVTSIIVGVSTEAQLEANLAAVATEAWDIDEINAAGQLFIS